MAYTYTFPEQTIPAGVLGFEVKLLQGSGSETLLDKYFSSDLTGIIQTDLKGGELASPAWDFTIDDDTNNLFQDTIFPTLTSSSVFSGDNNVIVAVTLNGGVKFIGTIIPKSISIEYYYSENDVLSGKRAKIQFSCIWIFEWLKTISAESLGTSLKDSAYSQTFTYNTITFYWASIYSTMKCCCDLLATNFGYTVGFSVENIGLTFYSNSYINDASFGAATNNFYAFNVFRVSNSFSFDDLSIESKDNGVGLLVGSNATDYETIGYFDKEENLYAQTAYDLFCGILNSLSLICKFSFPSSSNINVKVTSRDGGGDVLLPQVLQMSDVPFSAIGWDSIDIDSKISGNAVKKTYSGSGAGVFQKSLLLDFKNDTDLSGYIIDGSTGSNSIFSLCAPPIYGSLRMIREAGLGANQITNASFDTNLTGWTATSGSAGTWSHLNAIGKDGASGVAKLSNIANNGIHQLEQTITPDTRKLLGSYWMKIVPLTSDALNLVIKMYVNYYIGSVRYTGLEHTIYGTDLWTADNIASFIALAGAYPAGWNLVSSNYDYKFIRNVASRIRVDGSSRDDRNTLNDVRRGDRNREPMYEKFAIRIIPTTFSSGCAEVWVDGAKMIEGFINTPDIVSSTIEKNFIADNTSFLKKIKVNGILDGIDVADYTEYEGKTYYINKIRYNFKENETDIEAINYR